MAACRQVLVCAHFQGSRDCLIEVELLGVQDHLGDFGANHAAACCVRKVDVVEVTQERRRILLCQFAQQAAVKPQLLTQMQPYQWPQAMGDTRLDRPVIAESAILSADSMEPGNDCLIDASNRCCDKCCCPSRCLPSRPGLCAPLRTTAPRYSARTVHIAYSCCVHRVRAPAVCQTRPVIPWLCCRQGILLLHPCYVLSQRCRPLKPCVLEASICSSFDISALCLCLPCSTAMHYRAKLMAM